MDKDEKTRCGNTVTEGGKDGLACKKVKAFVSWADLWDMSKYLGESARSTAALAAALKIIVKQNWALMRHAPDSGREIREEFAEDVEWIRRSVLG